MGDDRGANRKPVRWVQYDVPLFVRVQPDDDGWGTETPMVLLVTDPQHMRLARDWSGHYLVYDENFEPIDNLDLDVKLDGIRGAVSVAEDKRDWPDHEHIVVLGKGWITGPDPRSGLLPWRRRIRRARCRIRRRHGRTGRPRAARQGRPLIAPSLFADLPEPLVIAAGPASDDTPITFSQAAGLPSSLPQSLRNFP